MEMRELILFLSSLPVQLRKEADLSVARGYQPNTSFFTALCPVKTDSNGRLWLIASVAAAAAQLCGSGQLPSEMQ